MKCGMEPYVLIPSSDCSPSDNGAFRLPPWEPLFLERPDASFGFDAALVVAVPL